MLKCKKRITNLENNIEFCSKFESLKFKVRKMRGIKDSKDYKPEFD